MTDDTLRLDRALVARGLSPTRQRAQNAISAGLVRVNGIPIQKNSVSVCETDEITLLGEAVPYVSRGALKLIAALDHYHVEVEGRICCDIGASTGGFTQVLLERGAKHIYAIDVGSNQLSPQLKSDDRVTSMEHCNARNLKRQDFAQVPSLAVMDVSFISIRLLLEPVSRILDVGGTLVALIKPQFEAGPSSIGKKGIVRDERTRLSAVKAVCDFASGNGWTVLPPIDSPILGGSGNREYLVRMDRRAR